MAETKKSKQSLLLRKIGKLIFENTELREGQANALATLIFKAVETDLGKRKARVTRGADGFPEQFQLSSKGSVECVAQLVLGDDALVIGLSGPNGQTFAECRLAVEKGSGVVGMLRRLDRLDLAQLILRSSS